MRTVAAVLFALTLGACAFSSEQPLFSESAAVTPFADGARFTWRENGDVAESYDVVYRRAGSAYDVLRADKPDERPMHVAFMELRDTPEDDYIAQVTLDETDARAYAFVWRTREGWRIVASPSAFAEGSAGQTWMNANCSARPNGECQFARSDLLLRFYGAVVRPAFLTGGVVPEEYIDQTPATVQP